MTPEHRRVCASLARGATDGCCGFIVLGLVELDREPNELGESKDVSVRFPATSPAVALLFLSRERPHDLACLLLPPARHREGPRVGDAAMLAVGAGRDLEDRSGGVTLAHRCAVERRPESAPR